MVYHHFQIESDVDYRRQELRRSASEARLALALRHHERTMRMDAFTSFVTVVGLLLLLAALSLRIGVDSGDAFATTERHLIFYGSTGEAPDSSSTFGAPGH